MRRMRAKMYPPVLPFRAVLENWKLLLMTAMFIGGLLIGSLLVRSDSSGLNATISSTFSDYYQIRDGQSFFQTFYNSIVSVLPFFLAAFIAGLSVFGVPVVVVIPAVRGLGLGIISGFLYAGFGLKGVAFSLLLIVPQSLISSVALILACRESLGFSSVFFSMILPSGTPYKMSDDAKMYCMRYGFLLLILLASAFVDALMSSAFLRFFTFTFS